MNLNYSYDNSVWPFVLFYLRVHEHSGQLNVLSVDCLVKGREALLVLDVELYFVFAQNLEDHLAQLELLLLWFGFFVKGAVNEHV